MCDTHTHGPSLCTWCESAIHSGKVVAAEAAARKAGETTEALHRAASALTPHLAAQLLARLDRPLTAVTIEHRWIQTSLHGRDKTGVSGTQSHGWWFMGAHDFTGDSRSGPDIRATWLSPDGKILRAGHVSSGYSYLLDGLELRETVWPTSADITFATDRGKPFLRRRADIPVATDTYGPLLELCRRLSLEDVTPDLVMEFAGKATRN